MYRVGSRCVKLRQSVRPEVLEQSTSAAEVESFAAQIDITAGYRIVSAPKLRMGSVGLLYWTSRFSKAVGGREDNFGWPVAEPQNEIPIIR
jgi:hypothetical protein